MKNDYFLFPMRLVTVLSLAVCTALVPSSASANAGAATAKIIVSGDEWAFSNVGFLNNPTYITNVLTWFGLMPNGSGKKVLILDGQSWNCGYNGTCGAFGSDLQSLLTSMGIVVTYIGYTNNLVPLTGYDAVFADGFMVKATTLTNDLALFVNDGGAVYLAGGTGTFSPPDPTGDADYWQPFLTAATGSSDFGLVGGGGWVEENPPLSFAGPIGESVANLSWYEGQGVQVGSNPSASAAIWDTQRTLVMTWSAPLPVQIQSLLLVGNNCTISFSTISNYLYDVQSRTDMVLGAWSTVISNIPGNDSITNYMDVTAGVPQKFYRIGQHF